MEEQITKYLDLAVEGIWRRIRELEAKEPVYAPVQLVTATGDLLLTPVFQDVPGVTLTVPPGKYLVLCICNIYGDDPNERMFARLVVNGVAQAAWVISDLELPVDMTVSQQWQITVTTDATMILQAMKLGGAGISIVRATHTNLSAIEARE